MLNIQLVDDKDLTPDAEKVYVMGPKEWTTNSVRQMFKEGEGDGFPIIVGRNMKVYKVLGHTVFPLSPNFDGVIWYSK